MPRKFPLAWISITVPAHLLKVADGLARRSALGEHRLAQLRSDMAMSLDERVHAAEEANRLDRALRPPCFGLRITLFDHYQDYLDWKKFEGITR